MEISSMVCVTQFIKRNCFMNKHYSVGVRNVGIDPSKQYYAAMNIT